MKPRLVVDNSSAPRSPPREFDIRVCRLAPDLKRAAPVKLCACLPGKCSYRRPE